MNGCRYCEYLFFRGDSLQNDGCLTTNDRKSSSSHHSLSSCFFFLLLALTDNIINSRHRSSAVRFFAICADTYRTVMPISAGLAQSANGPYRGWALVPLLQQCPKALHQQSNPIPGTTLRRTSHSEKRNNQTFAEPECCIPLARHPYPLLSIRYWRKFDLELADRRSRCKPRKKCPNRWRSHLLPRMRQFSKRASSGHQ